MAIKLNPLTRTRPPVKLNEEVALNYPFWMKRDRIPEFKDMPEAGDYIPLSRIKIEDMPEARDYIPLSRIKIEKVDLRETGVECDYIISFFSAKINKWVRVHDVDFDGRDLGYSVEYSSPLLKTARVQADAIIRLTNRNALNYTKSLTVKDEIKLDL